MGATNRRGMIRVSAYRASDGSGVEGTNDKSYAFILDTINVGKIGATGYSIQKRTIVYFRPNKVFIAIYKMWQRMTGSLEKINGRTYVS